MSNTDEAKEAASEARRAQIMSWVWWALIPLVSVAYWVISSEAGIEKAMLVFLADVSLVANAVSYASKAKALEAKQASYENP
jgi:hypothetical protein